MFTDDNVQENMAAYLSSCTPNQTPWWFSSTCFIKGGVALLNSLPPDFCLTKTPCNMSAFKTKAQKIDHASKREKRERDWEGGVYAWEISSQVFFFPQEPVKILSTEANHISWIFFQRTNWKVPSFNPLLNVLDCSHIIKMLDDNLLHIKIRRIVLDPRWYWLHTWLVLLWCKGGIFLLQHVLPVGFFWEFWGRIWMTINSWGILLNIPSWRELFSEVFRGNVQWRGMLFDNIRVSNLLQMTWYYLMYCIL